MRDWHASHRYELTDEDRSTRCGSPIPGRFDGSAGR